MKLYKKKKTEEVSEIDVILEATTKKKEVDVEEEEKMDPNGISMVVERIEHGLIGSLRIEDGLNKPMFIANDIVHFRNPSRLQIKDFILYKSHDEYFVRRIIKYGESGIYVAGDNEREYRLVRKEDIVGKAIGRQRGSKYLSLSLKNSKPVYTFAMVNLAKIRLGNRVLGYEEEVNHEALEIAMSKVNVSNEKPIEYKYDFDLDSDLSAFLDPDVLVQQLEEAKAAELASAEEYVEIEEYEEYVEEIEVEEESSELEDDEASEIDDDITEEE